MSKTLFTLALGIASLFATHSHGAEVYPTNTHQLLMAVGKTPEYKEFLGKVAYIESASVETYEDLTVYELVGVVMLGGDVPCGDVILTIKESRVPATFGFGSVSVYAGSLRSEIYNKACE